MNREDRDLRNFVNSLNARVGIIHLTTREEDRALRWVFAHRSRLKGAARRVRSWTFSTGLVDYSPMEFPPADQGTRPPANALRSVLDEVRSRNGAGAGATLYVFRDLHSFYNDREVLRHLRDVSHALRGTDDALILLSPRVVIPEDLESEIELCDFPLPSRAQLGRMIYDDIIKQFAEDGRAMDRSAELREAVLRAMSGMTYVEAENAIAKAVAEHGTLSWDVVGSINREKRRFVRRIQGLDFLLPEERGLQDVGGMDALKRWLAARSLGFSEEAAEFGLEPPRGVLLLGFPGTGKSLTAKALSAELKMPLLRLDLAAVKEGVVGQSTSNLLAALRAASSLSPTVLWVDEVEKAVAGAAASFVGDSGVAKELFGVLLTWMQEQKGSFVIFTANDVSSLPPELLRKGRLDEIFFVDLPTLAERLEILGIHVGARGRSLPSEDLLRVARATEGFAGSELRQLVLDALYQAFHERARGESGDLRVTHLLDAAGATIPLSKSMADRLQPLRDFVTQGRAVPASSSRSVGISTVAPTLEEELAF